MSSCTIRTRAQTIAPLTEGEAVRVDATQRLARIVNITGTLQPGEWSTQPTAGGL